MKKISFLPEATKFGLPNKTDFKKGPDETVKEFKHGEGGICKILKFGICIIYRPLWARASFEHSMQKLIIWPAATCDDNKVTSSVGEIVKSVDK